MWGPCLMTRAQRFWVVLVATLVTMAVTASLGLWQLDRAAQKQALFAQIESRRLDTPLGNQDLQAGAPSDLIVHRLVRLHGRWLAQHTVFLDNRQMNGVPGFFVVTPLQLNDRNLTVLVQRGWVARDFQDRTRLPAIDTPAQDVTIEGRLTPPPAKLYELGEAGAGPIRQNIDLDGFAAETGISLYGLSVLQTGAETGDGLLRDWPRIEAGVAKHHGYAFQWFGLCALVALLFVWFQIIAPRRTRTFHEPNP